MNNIYFEIFIKGLSLCTEDGSKTLTPPEVLFREIADLTDKVQRGGLKDNSSRERRRANNLIQEKRKKLEKLLIDQGLQRLQNGE